MTISAYRDSESYILSHNGAGTSTDTVSNVTGITGMHGSEDSIIYIMPSDLTIV